MQDPHCKRAPIVVKLFFSQVKKSPLKISLLNLNFIPSLYLAIGSWSCELRGNTLPLCCCCWVTSVVSDSVWPHRRQPTCLPRPWDSPGKDTGVGCHFLLQWKLPFPSPMKVKSESEVTQSCPTLSDPMGCSLPGSSIHGIFQSRVLEWVAISFSRTALLVTVYSMQSHSMHNEDASELQRLYQLKQEYKCCLRAIDGTYF